MEKTRDISKLNYFEQLQREYISAHIRSCIYFKPSDKKYWKGVRAYKAKRINSLSFELGLDSLLECSVQYKRFKDEVLQKGELPKFTYKSDGSDSNLKETDLKNYYSVGSDVIALKSNNITETGVITQVNHDTLRCLVTFSESEEELLFTQLIRLV